MPPAAPLAVHRLELHPPAKAAALAYIDGSGPRPAREARATIFIGTPPALGRTEQSVVQVRVGPLQDGAVPTYAEVIAQPELPYIMRPVDDREYAAFEVVRCCVQEDLGGIWREGTPGCALEG